MFELAKLICLVVYNMLRGFIMKLRFGKGSKIHWLQRISPFCSLNIYGKGNLVIGRNCQFPAGCDLTVLGNGRLVLGERVIMNKYCVLSAHCSIEIGDNCLIGPGVKIFDNYHRFSKEHGAKQELSVAPIKIGKNCWLGSNAVILKGTNIGDNCVIGAGCVVKGTIPSCSIVRPNVNNIIEEIR